MVTRWPCHQLVITNRTLFFLSLLHFSLPVSILNNHIDSQRENFSSWKTASNRVSPLMRDWQLIKYPVSLERRAYCKPLRGTWWRKEQEKEFLTRTRTQILFLAASRTDILMLQTLLPEVNLQSSKLRFVNRWGRPLLIVESAGILHLFHCLIEITGKLKHPDTFYG